MISGAIASGKSTVASAVTNLMRASGLTVALTDLDTVAEMTSPPAWDWAHRVHGGLVAAWLATPIDLVIDEGTSSPHEVDLVLAQVPERTKVKHVVLIADYASSLERARRDDGRGMSRDPEFLRHDHDTFADSLPDLPCDLRLYVEGRSPQDLADEICRAAGSILTSGREGGGA